MNDLGHCVQAHNIIKKTMKEVNPIPEGYHTVTPYLMVEDAEAYSKFLQLAFNGVICSSTKSANGTFLNIEMKIGTSMVMLAEVRGGFTQMPMSFYMYVEDVDSVYKQAISHGATSLNEPSDKFYGNRDCGIIDVKGNYWFIASMIEELTEEEITARITPETRKRKPSS